MKPEPLDIILCSGRAFVSKRIIYFNKLMGIKDPARQISHIAQMTYNGFVIESTTLNKWCNKTGVQANRWEDWLHNYKGEVWVRKYPDDPKPHKETVRNFDVTWLATPYENGIPGVIELIKAGLGWGKLKATTNIHCSEIVTMKMKLLKYLPEDTLNYILSPAQYWIGGKFDQLSSVAYGPPQQVK